jgi:hypothetical protein
MWDEIVAKVVSILEANTLIQEVSDFEKVGFDGFPAATVTPSSDDGDYDTTSENREVYALRIGLFVRRGEDVGGQREAEVALRQLVDSVKRDFTADYTLSGITAPTGYTVLFVEAVPSAWGYMDDREGNLRVAEITLRIHVDVDVTQVS